MRLARRPVYKWLLVGMLWFVCFFNYADRQAIFSVFPLLQRELHLSDVQLGIVGSSFMWTYALFGPAAGWLCDRLPRKTLVLGGLVFWSVVTTSTGLAHSYTQLLVCRALGGLGEAFYFPASMSLISDYHGRATRSRAMSLHHSTYTRTALPAGLFLGGSERARDGGRAFSTSACWGSCWVGCCGYSSTSRSAGKRRKS